MSSLMINFSSESFPLWCRFYPHNDYGYTCMAMEIEIISKENRTVTSVRGAPLSGKTLDDVALFAILSRPVYFFPKDVDKFFKNILNLQISHSNLTEVTQDDLKPFGCNLEMLIMTNNEIEVIAANLFEFNLNLEKIVLSNNRIKFIDFKTFSSLNLLKTLDFSNNSCIVSNQTANSRSNVIKIIKNIKINCSSSE